MKKSHILRSLNLLLFALIWLSYSHVSIAEHEINGLYTKTYNASNTCFPRTFSQINQFQVSSGGLRNIHPNPRSVICSINSESSTLIYPSNPEGTRIVLYFAALPAEMPCTIYTRNNETAALISSLTATFPAGATVGSFGDPYGLQWHSDYNDSYSYLQCRIPGGGRIFTYTASFYYEEEL